MTWFILDHSSARLSVAEERRSHSALLEETNEINLKYGGGNQVAVGKVWAEKG